MTPNEIAKLAVESNRYDSLSTFFGVVNIGLVVLTAIVTIFTFYYGNKLSEVKEKIANQKIAEADVKAAVANQKAKEASSNAEIAKASSASANLAATEAKNRQTELAIELEKEKQRLNNSNIKRAQAELALNNKIEEDRRKALPRRLSSYEKEKILALLKQFPTPSRKVEVSVIMGDKESKSYGLDYANILKSSGWATETGVNEVVYSDDPSGIFIAVRRNQPAIPPEALLLQRVLRQIGIDAMLFDGQGMKDGQVELLIGHKPQK